ncbi:hypothetical protein Wcon_00798 [Wolbachia endosymbiont of Cylisticus convexus]|nr:hypothetical protein [Wolbachia endosymbiont of Cylisticus convexus]RDD35061.1 hypothetical protein Wcon_00798 [Wolbachia endosymbiont of Cylisticus convexus]
MTKIPIKLQDLRRNQSESRTGMAILGNLRSCLQDGDTRRSLQANKEE